MASLLLLPLALFCKSGGPFPVSIVVQNATLDSAVTQLARSARVSVSVSPDVRRAMQAERVTARISNVKLDDALAALLMTAESHLFGLRPAGEGFRIEEYNRYRTMTSCAPAYRQPPAIAKKEVTLLIADVPGPQAMERLFAENGASYAINSRIAGKVSLNLVR